MKIKSGFNLLIGCILMQCISSCSQNKFNSVTIFSGTIKNNGSTEVRIENDDTVLISKVDSTGFFKIVFNLSKETTFEYIGNEIATIYLSPGDSLYITEDAQDWRSFEKTLTFSGKGSPKNTYYYSKLIMVDQLLESNKINLLKMNSKSFISSLDSLCSILTNNFIEFRKEYSKEKYGLFESEPEDIGHLKNIFIINYFLYNKENGIFNKEILGLVDRIISSIDFNNKSHVYLVSYQNLIIACFDYWLYSVGVTDQQERLVEVLKKIDNDIQIPELKRKIAKHYIESYIAKNIWQDQVLNRIKGEISKESFIDFSKIVIASKPLSSGSEAPEFKLYDPNGKEYTLESFHGKFIFIDVWATYCPPCVKEIPYFEKLKTEFKGKNIVFISVSLDRKENDWKSVLNNKGMTDYQLKPQKDWSSDFVRDYSLNYYGIPHYILISPVGIILRSPAPKPSEVKNLLEEILL